MAGALFAFRHLIRHAITTVWLCHLNRGVHTVIEQIFTSDCQGGTQAAPRQKQQTKDNNHDPS